jgi:hypothetical protein
MSAKIEITYINKSINKDLPTIFVFFKNETPIFDTLKEGVAWRTLPNIGEGSSISFELPIATEVEVTWADGKNKTRALPVQVGKRYTVSKNDTGIVLMGNGRASDQKCIDVNNDTNIQGGMSALLYKGGNVILKKRIVGYGQKAEFALKPKLYWGVASEMKDGQMIDSGVLRTDHFFEQDLEGISEVIISFNGNTDDGYSFKIEKQR